MLPVTYSNLCPVCNGDVGEEEIAHARCTAKGEEFCMIEKEVEEFIAFFTKCVGEPRAIQKMWAKRVLRGESFAATAPTGIGKTSFGIVISLFQALKGKRCYLLFPTSLLVEQAVKGIERYAEKASIPCEKLAVGYYHGKMGKKDKESFFKNLSTYRILITTIQFLAKHYKELGSFDFIFVDDVDAVLKASKNVDRLLSLLGFYWDSKSREWKGEAKGCLMVSTATAKKGKKAELFRKLLNFDIGSSRIAVRNIEDVAVNSENPEIMAEILRKLGHGGIIYARSAGEAERIYNSLKDKFRIGIVTATKKKDYERFVNGEIDHLVGTAYYYGTLVRGLDLPERIRFAVFVGCPSFRIRIEDIDRIKPAMLRVLGMLYRHTPEIERILPKLDRQTEFYEELKALLKKVMKEHKPKAKDVVLRESEVIFPDVRTYIQGSGRTSRLFAGGLTKGASFLLENDANLLSAFVERAKYYDIEFKTIEEIDFDNLVKELNESREKFRKMEKSDMIKPAIFIVESPTKAKQISHFFGKPSIKVLDGAVVYEIPMEKYVLLVTASLGHVVDLITNRGFHGVTVDNHSKFVPVYASIKRCKDCGYQFTEEVGMCPKCNSKNIDDSKSRIKALRKLAKDAGFIIIGTDPDTEGEKIAWDLKNLLSGCGEIKRAEFHEVTKRAILEALESLRNINENLVKAQIVRRVEDRWIGFALSQKLWKKFKNHNLSAGRAQTPVLGWVISRNLEARQKKTIAVIKDFDLTLEYDKKEFDLTISLLEEKEEVINPLPPYTTDVLLRDANVILKLSAKQTMQIAQELFENGLITYHRTDSTRVSDVGLRIAKDYLGDDFEARTWRQEGAHECIRPTRALDRDNLQRLIQEGVIVAEGLKWYHFALYDLIFRRFMASQCKPFAVRIKKYEINFERGRIEEERIVDAKGKAYELYRSVWVKKEIPLGKYHVTAEIKKVPKVLPLSQSEIIWMMKERRIGRPSTYATILDRLFIRKYVVEKFGKVFPTKLGKNVYSYLSENYGKFVSEERTRQLEEKMDAIERGEMNYFNALAELYSEISEI